MKALLFQRSLTRLPAVTRTGETAQSQSIDPAGSEILALITIKAGLFVHDEEKSDTPKERLR